ncbi:MAG: family 16 glycosylhydrolase [Solirubrobacteraceae bacterium]
MGTTRRCPGAIALLSALAAAVSAWAAAPAAAQIETLGPRLLWSDEFNGSGGRAPDRRRWEVINGGNGFGNRELQYYTRRSINVRLNGHGALVLSALRGPFAGSDGFRRSYTSGALQTKGRFQTVYRRLEARIKIPAGRGLWPAFWAVGSNVDAVRWPQSGEIDMMENLGNDPFTLLGSIHGPQLGHGRGYALTTALRMRRPLSAGYHVYGVDWSPARLVFTFDGVPYSTRTPAGLPHGATWAFDHPFFLILNLAVGGTWPGRPDRHTRFPARMLVDWVRVYTL